MAGPSSTVDQNLLPVQAYFDVYGNFQTFIGQGQPFFATFNPNQSGLHITNSTIDSSTIGATTPSTGVFTNVLGTTGQISTTPSANIDIANKFYVDTVAQGLGPKAACQVATTVDLASLSGLLIIDTYQTVAGDRVLVKNQTSTQFNGIYVASTTAWNRATDMDTWAEVPGAYTVILNGSQSNTGWVCTATSAGTINVTAITFVQFSSLSTYYAGTGLSLSSNTFSITPVGSAGTYGSASAVPVFITNASGQVTSVTNTSIAIANTAVSGLGTMSTQNANAVAITGGTINTATIGQSTAGLITGTTIVANTQFTGAGTGLTGLATSLNIGGNAATATSATSASSVTNSATFNSGGAGGASPITFNGSVAQTISYNTIGAPSVTGTGASGTWSIGISGNAGTVTNGLYSTGSYSNPSWLTSILGSIVSGAVASATLATTATNIGGGLAGSLPYQTGAGATSFLSLGTTNYVLTAGATAPQYVAQSTLSVGSATTATTATNLAGGVASNIPYQTGAGATSFIGNGTAGQFLQSNGASVPTWTTPVAYATVTDDTTTTTTRYPLFANQTTGNLATTYTSSTKYKYVPSTGTLTATVFSGSGASLTSIPNSALTNSSVTIGSTAVSLGATVTTFAGLTSVSSTTFVGALTGNASTATTATTATNATNTAITDNTSSIATWYPTLVSTTTGNLPQTTSSTKLSFVPSTGVLSANGVALTGNLGTVTSVAALTIGTTGTDLTSTIATGTTTPVITLQVPTASASNRGALSSTDWSTFNGKQAALVSGTSIKTVSGTTLLGAGDLGTIGVGYGGTGTATAFTTGSIVFAGASGVYNQSNANFFWDNTNSRLGIYATTPRYVIDIGGLYSGVGLNISGANQAYTIYQGTPDTAGYFHSKILSDRDATAFSYAGYLAFYTEQKNTANTTDTSTEKMRLHASGGLSIGNTVDKGAASLNVSGLIYPQQATTAGAPAYVKGAIYFDTTLNKLRVGGATAWETITSI